MTLEEAKLEWRNKAADFMREHGTIGYEKLSGDLVDIGNGYKVHEDIAADLTMEAIDIVLEEQE